jgi:hypothetical protein
MNRSTQLMALITVTIASIVSACKKDPDVKPEAVAIVRPNKQPVADAGRDLNIILPVNSVVLDGSASTDPDNNIRSYNWKKTSGPSSFTFNNADIAKPQVSDLVQGVYEFELKVTDSAGLFAKDTVVVAVDDTIFIAGADIYVIGFNQRSEFSDNKPVLWKNGIEQTLGNGSNFYNPSSIFVSGNDVFVAGWGSATNVSGNGVAVLWKNGLIQNLTDGSNNAYALSVFVSGSDVYVAGTEEHSVTHNTVAKIWKNGVVQNLTDGSTSAGASSVFVSEGNIYVAGYEVNSLGHFVATIWKNGVPQKLTDSTNEGIAKSVFVSDGNVYVAGYDQTSHMLWKNGVAQNYSATMLNSIFVSGSDVYVAGHRDYEYIGYPELWKNGVAQNLGNSLTYGEANSVYVSNTGVFVAGWGWDLHALGPSAKLWINGVARNLAVNSYRSSATAVFVVKK